MPFKLQDPNPWPCLGSQELAIIYPSSLLFCVSFCLCLPQTFPFCAPVSTATIPFILTTQRPSEPSELCMSSSSLELPKCVGFFFFFFCWPSALQLVQSQRERSWKEHETNVRWHKRDQSLCIHSECWGGVQRVWACSLSHRKNLCGPFPPRSLTLLHSCRWPF